MFTLSKTQKFWEWFAENSEEYFNMGDYDEKLFQQLNVRLSHAVSGAVFEISSPKKGKRDLIISADGIVKYSRAVKDLVSAAPKLSGWNIIAFRPRVGETNIELDGIKINSANFYYLYDIDTETSKVNLQIYIKNYNEKDADKYMSAFFIILDALVGEYDVMTKIGIMEFYNIEEAGDKKLHPLKNLVKIIDSLHQPSTQD